LGVYEGEFVGSKISPGYAPKKRKRPAPVMSGKEKKSLWASIG